jgi:hypothetical protein
LIGDCTSKFAFAELHPHATRTIANGFLNNLIKAVPYKIHTVLTDNGHDTLRLRRTQLAARKRSLPPAASSEQSRLSRAASRPWCCSPRESAARGSATSPRLLPISPISSPRPLPASDMAIGWSNKVACAEGAACARPLPNHIVKAGLALATVLVTGVIAFDLFAPLLLNP